MSYVFVVLGDIHYGAFNGYSALGGKSSSWNRDPYAYDIYDSLLGIITQSTSHVDSIFVPGDLTSIASPEEFIGCKSVVERLGSDIGVSNESIFYTYGNHDTNWLVSKLSERGEHGEDLGYNELAGKLGGLFAPNPNLVQGGPMPGSGLVRHLSADIYILNTGYDCVSSQVVPHGRVGAEQLAWIEGVLEEPPDSSRWRIVMLHHHPHNYPYPVPVQDLSQVAEGAELVQLFGRYGVDFVCHGHRHHPILRTMSEVGWAHPVTYLCAGSLSVDEAHRAKGGIPNTVHIVSLDKRGSNDAANGKTLSFEFSTDSGWIPAEYRKVVAVDPIQEFGAFAFRRDHENSINGIIGSPRPGGARHTDLPDYKDLPHSLRCLLHIELNEIFKTQAGKLDGVLVGKYPSECLVRWSK